MNPCGCPTFEHLSRDICHPFEEEWIPHLNARNVSVQRKVGSRVEEKWTSPESFEYAQTQKLLWDVKHQKNAFLFAQPSVLNPHQLGVFARRCLCVRAYEKGMLHDIVGNFSINHLMYQKIRLAKNQTIIQGDVMPFQVTPICLGVYQGEIIHTDANTLAKDTRTHLLNYAVSFSNGMVVSHASPQESWPCLLNHSPRFAQLHLDTKTLKVYVIDNIVRGQELLWNYGSEYWLSAVMFVEEPSTDLKSARCMDLWNKIFCTTENYSLFFDYAKQLAKLSLSERFLLAYRLWIENYAQVTTPAYIKRKEEITLQKLTSQLSNSSLS